MCFGNGMLLSKHIRMQAAFNHMHIFIDPNPESASSWVERERLFRPTLAQVGKITTKILSLKVVASSLVERSPSLTPFRNSENAGYQEAHQWHRMNDQSDLVYAGWSSFGMAVSVHTLSLQTRLILDVGDRANDVLRIDGRDSSFKVVGEGGNLGMTQLVSWIRAPYHSGRVNTRLLDNVGGVDCSDNEVNIKIFLEWFSF